ncbi:distal tail protein Dit [Edaphobacillus lindanitolerans]|uniref:Putative phage tail component, N-terminal domain-containing protein n=1 Tax=Edaphobacillus lindanitolerans TaxID=550447 RepID=A0A1U7PTA4_9BACI|nr:distal tail protein Dit [Edaphobacillus lindanitolerans]SIT91740.1 putative phage tail component, N-terminal domain-containing protein [Edaphobacillus lindanitolerans]
MYEFVKATDAPQTKTATIQTVFDGVNLDEVLTDSTGEFRTTKVLGRSNYHARLSPVEIPGRAGTQLAESVQDAGELKIFFKVKDQTSRGLQRRLDRLRGMLTGIDRPVMFTDEDSVYYGTLESLEIPDEVSNDVTGEFTLYRADPLKYGTEYSMPINSEGTVVQNKGTAEALPVFSFNVTEPSTMIEIASEDDYMAIGRPLSVEDTPYQRQKRLIWDEARSLVGWGASIIQPDGGARNGSMQVVDGEEFEAKDYGNGLAWHGPVIQQALSETCDDWFVRCYFNVRTNKAAQRGRAEMYLLSTSNEIIGKISVACNDNTGRAKVEANLRNGQRRVFFCNKLLPFRDGFYGYLNMRKEGNKFFAEFGLDRRVNGVYEVWHKESFTYTDLHNEFQTPLAAVALHTGTYRTDLIPWRARIRSAVVVKYNLQDTGIPYIVDAGDEVTIDHEREVILVNGEIRTDLKDFGANYFPLKRGENILTFNPPGSFTGNIQWRERYV